MIIMFISITIIIIIIIISSSSSSIIRSSSIMIESCCCHASIDFSALPDATSRLFSTMKRATSSGTLGAWKTDGATPVGISARSFVVLLLYYYSYY